MISARYVLKNLCNLYNLKKNYNFIGHNNLLYLQNLPCSNGFLESTVAVLPGWRRVLSSYPVVTWSNFIEYLRSTVNLLASEEHMKELIYKLQLMGEVSV